jgi:hypothetical protein
MVDALLASESGCVCKNKPPPELPPGWFMVRLNTSFNTSMTIIFSFAKPDERSLDSQRWSM